MRRGSKRLAMNATATEAPMGVRNTSNRRPSASHLWLPQCR